mgnify:CR=1 FL=1
MALLQKYPKAVQWSFLLLVFFGLCFAIEVPDGYEFAKAGTEFIDKDNLTIEEQRVLNLKKLAVRKYEMQEVSKYPAVLSLIDDFQKNKFFLKKSV